MMMCWLATSVLGQGVGPAPEQTKWVAVVIALVLAVGVLVAAAMNAKRSHKD